MAISGRVAIIAVIGLAFSALMVCAFMSSGRLDGRLPPRCRFCWQAEGWLALSHCYCKLVEVKCWRRRQRGVTPNERHQPARICRFSRWFLAAGALRGWSAQRSAKALRRRARLRKTVSMACVRAAKLYARLSIGHYPSGVIGRWIGWRFDTRDRISDDYCHETCAACAQVSHEGDPALSTGAKPDYKIGTARVIHDKCLAWKHGEYCMVCDEFCPYKAVRVVKHGGVNCPEVDEALCRGCGAVSVNARLIRGLLWLNATEQQRKEISHKDAQDAQGE